MQIRADYSTDLDAATHPAFDIALLVRLLEQEGRSPAELLAGSGLSGSLLDEPDTRISFRQKLIVFENVIRLSKDPAVGLHAGCHVHFSNFGILGYAVISSATFAKGIELGMKYIRLAGPVLHKTVSVRNDLVCFEGSDPLALGPLLPFTAEFWLSSTRTLMSEMLGRPVPSRRLKLPYRAPAYREEYERLFQCPVEFGTGVIEWYLDAALLDQPMPNANPQTAALCAQTCENLLANLESRNDLVHQIRAMLFGNPGRFSNIETIAKSFHISSRTLRRKLKALGTTYQRILDDTRRRLAIQYLENTGMTIEEVAERVGFSEAANFSQAFKKWTGSSPSSLRKR